MAFVVFHINHLIPPPQANLWQFINPIAARGSVLNRQPPWQIINTFIAGHDFLRQILTSKAVPHAERITYLNKMVVDP